jgi:transposase
MRDNEFTKILGWPGYRVYRHEIDEAAKTLRLWVRRKRGNRKLICSGCGRKFSEAHDYNEREVRDLPWGESRSLLGRGTIWTRAVKHGTVICGQDAISHCSQLRC